SWRRPARVRLSKSPRRRPGVEPPGPSGQMMYALLGRKGDRAMPTYTYDHIHLRSPDPDRMARFFETMFGAEVTRDIYPPGTLYPGQMRVRMRVGGQTVLIAPPHPHEQTGSAPAFPHYGLEHFGLTVDNLDEAVAELRAKGAEIAVGPVMRNPG